jgi:hypothetical protein
MAVDALFAINTLQGIDLSENDLNGTIPELILPKTKLTHLKLGGNKNLTGRWRLEYVWLPSHQSLSFRSSASRMVERQSSHAQFILHKSYRVGNALAS